MVKVVAPGYKLGLIRNAEHTKNPTKKITMGTGPTAVTRVQQQGIIGPVIQAQVLVKQSLLLQLRKKDAVRTAVS